MLTDANSPNKREIEYWNSEATRPWAHYHEPIDRLFASLTQTAIEVAAPQPGEHVIDIGCGSGTTVLNLAARVGPTGHVFGADISQASVAVAEERIVAAKVSQAHVSICDLSTADLPTAAFDLAFSRFGVMFFADPISTFTRLRAAMKPDGRLCFVVFRTPKENPWGTAPLAALSHLLPAPPPPGPDEPGQFSWSDPDRVNRILGGAGFRDIQLIRHDPEIQIAPAGGAAQAADFAMRIGPVVRAMASASVEPDAVRRALQEFFAKHDGPNGVAMPGAIWIVRAIA